VTAIIPFIFIHCHYKAELRQGMDLGADDYLIKPSTAELLGDRSSAGKTGSP